MDKDYLIVNEKILSDLEKQFRPALQHAFKQMVAEGYEHH